jgi:hypothetical protein
LRIGDCPSCDAGQDQSGGAGCEQIGRLAHLNPPVVPTYCEPIYTPSVSWRCRSLSLFVSSVSPKPRRTAPVARQIGLR